MSDPYVEKVIANILRHEGGYQNDVEDSGNYTSKGSRVGTNWGIAAPTYEKWLGREPTLEDMKRMRKEEAKEIYRKQYIDSVEERFGVPPKHEAWKQMVDMNVNHSPEGVATVLQRALGVKVDGLVGPKTREALKKVDGAELNARLVEERKNYYQELVKRNPDRAKYLRGWLKRAESFR